MGYQYVNVPKSQQVTVLNMKHEFALHDGWRIYSGIALRGWHKCWVWHDYFRTGTDTGLHWCDSVQELVECDSYSGEATKGDRERCWWNLWFTTMKTDLYLSQIRRNDVRDTLFIKGLMTLHTEKPRKRLLSESDMVQHDNYSPRWAFQVLKSNSTLNLKWTLTVPPMLQGLMAR